MVEISRDGKRVYWTNSLYSTWDNHFYPDGVPGAEVMANASPSGGLELAKDYWVSFPDGYRAHRDPARGRRLLDGFVLLSVGLNLSGVEWTPTGLWLALVASGLYHGVNPGMGWPLAVSAGLMERSSRALIAALWPLALGHLLAMLVVILPFALLIAVVEWQQQIKSAPVSWSSFRRLPAGQQAPSAGAGADTTNAILMHVHPVLPWNLKLQQPQLPRSEPDGQPTESSQLDCCIW